MTFSEFSDRTDRLASALDLPLNSLYERLEISRDTFFGCRTGRTPISRKTVRKLKTAETAAGLQIVEESPAEYGKTNVKISSSDEQEARRLFEETLTLARENPQRIGWLIEQLRLHLRPPAHWHVYHGDPKNHPAVKAALERGLGKASAFQSPASKTDTAGGSSQVAS